MTGALGLAIASALLASVAFNLGLVLEKRALRTMPQVDARHAARLLRILLSSPAWLGGFSLMLCGFALQVVALTFAPVSVVQPVLGSGVVILLGLSRLVLRERLRWAELACVLSLAAAIVMIALSAAGPAGQVGYQVNGRWFAAIAGSACLAALALGASSGRSAAAAAGVSYGVSAGLFYGVATLAIKGFSGLLHQHPATITLLLAVAKSPYPYLAVTCSAAGMVIFQTGLQRCRVSIVGPVSSITGSVFFIIAGTWLFGEELPAAPVKLLLRVGGVVAAGAAVLLLAWGSEVPEEAEQEVTIMCP